VVPSVYELQSADLALHLAGEPRYRVGQVWHGLWSEGRDVADITTVPKALRQRLAAEFPPALEVVNDVSSDLGATRKWVFRLHDGATIETVLMGYADRVTVCISSQAGCAMGCTFCATGQAGFSRQLSIGEVIEQVMFAARAAAPRRLSNVVFMGMGEPLANYANVIQAIRVMHDPGCFNIGARKITLSTVGVPAKMRELANENLPLNLAISLHAPNEELRKQLIPWAEHFALDDILAAARYYFDQTGREVTLEYILLAGVNDQVPHAKELAKLCKTLRANVNLIRYNAVEGLPFARPKSDDVLRFQDVLKTAGVNAHVRKSRGRDIDAACGQLRRKKLEEQSEIAVPEGVSLPVVG